MTSLPDAEWFGSWTPTKNHTRETVKQRPHILNNLLGLTDQIIRTTRTAIQHGQLQNLILDIEMAHITYDQLLQGLLERLLTAIQGVTKIYAERRQRLLEMDERHRAIIRRQAMLPHFDPNNSQDLFADWHPEDDIL